MKKEPAARLSTDPAAPGQGAGSARRRHSWLVLAALLLLLVAAAAAWAVRYVAALVPTTPNVDNIRKVRAEQPSVVLSADGKQLAVFRRPDRDWVKLADISPAVLQALIATEDRRFYEHRGVDASRTIAAALHTLRGDREGGSTITQQLARNLYPEEIGRAPTIERKIREAITARKIESAYSKQEILETYLNTVPFLYNAYGIEMAARTYFDKPARDLDVLESATLVAMLKGTRTYNPVLYPERARQRRNLVLAQMVRDNRLTPQQFDQLKDQPLRLDFTRQEPELGPAPHFVQQLRRWLIDWADRNGHDIRSDGLVVHTTIDSRLQAMATEALTRQADKLQAMADKAWRPSANQDLLQTFLRETPQYRALRDSGADDARALKRLQAERSLVQSVWQNKTRLQAGFMAINPASGEVKAWVGSRDFKQDQFDHVEQARRQPGSTFKPFVYGAAFDQGISPDDVLLDQAPDIPLADGRVWRPVDIERPSNLPISVRDGLVHSKNTITAQVMQQVGPARVAEVAYRLGVRQSKLDPVPSLALGTSPVTLKEMVTAYAGIVNDGSSVEPMIVTRIEDRQHHVLAQFKPMPPQPGLRNAAAQTLLDVMRGVIDRGTGVGIRRRYGLKGDLAGKTGTTQDYTDGWFILMQPQLVGGAWVGFNDNRVTMSDAWGQGARNALHIVGDFFQHAQNGQLIDPKARFAAPHLPPRPPAVPMFGPYAGSDWSAGVYQNAPPAVVADPTLARPQIVVPRPAVVAAPQPQPRPAAPGADTMAGLPGQAWIVEQGRTVDLSRWAEDASGRRRSQSPRVVIIQVPGSTAAVPDNPAAFAVPAQRQDDSAP